MEFDKDCHHIMAMKSLQGETVPLKRKVKIVPEVEVICQNGTKFSVIDFFFFLHKNIKRLAWLIHFYFGYTITGLILIDKCLKVKQNSWS